MAVNVEITRQLGDFKLDIRFSSHARRIGILGASGCGKSITLKSIAGIELPDSGRIEISGRVLFEAAEEKCWLSVSELRAVSDNDSGTEYCCGAQRQ